MFNTENATYEPVREIREETAKVILVDIDAILKELGAELRRIDDAIYSPKNREENTNEPMDECLLGQLARQRYVAQELLNLAIHIREGLW